VPTNKQKAHTHRENLESETKLLNNSELQTLK